MSVISIERNQYRRAFNGSGALKLESPIKPILRIVPAAESEYAPNPKVTSISEYRERKNREKIIQAVPESITQTPHADLLNGTGFTSSEEMDSLRCKFNEGIAEGRIREEIISDIVRENLTNIRWYQWEYTMSNPVLLNPIAHNENRELINSISGNSIVKATSEGERDGSVKQSVINAQNLLKDAKEGDTVMIVSPPGYTGRFDENGKDIVYPEAEIFAFLKGEGRNIRALTFISELTLEQCEQFRDYFISPNPDTGNEKLSEREKIAAMVASPILVTGERVNFENILDKIQVLKGVEIMRAANGANRTFTEAREFLARGEEVHRLPEICEAIIGEYEKLLRHHIENINDPNVFNLIRQGMELTVLEIASALKGSNDNTPKQASRFYTKSISIHNTTIIDRNIVQNNYDQQIAYLKTRPGCNGGGSSTSSGIFGSTLSEVLSGNTGGSIGSVGGLSLNGEGAKCSTCNLELCEGRCPNCEQSEEYQKAA